jgi:hypothetical protein
VRDEICMLNARNGEDFQGELPAPLPSLIRRGLSPIPEDFAQDATKEPQRFRPGKNALMVLQFRSSRASCARKQVHSFRFACQDRLRERLQRGKGCIVHAAGVVGHSPDGSLVASAGGAGKLDQRGDSISDRGVGGAGLVALYAEIAAEIASAVSSGRLSRARLRARSRLSESLRWKA